MCPFIPSLCPLLTPSSPKRKPHALQMTPGVMLLFHLGNKILSYDFMITSIPWLSSLYSSSSFSTTLQFRCPQASPSGHVIITNTTSPKTETTITILLTAAAWLGSVTQPEAWSHWYCSFNDVPMYLLLPLYLPVYCNENFNPYYSYSKTIFLPLHVWEIPSWLNFSPKWSLPSLNVWSTYWLYYHLCT